MTKGQWMQKGYIRYAVGEFKIRLRKRINLIGAYLLGESKHRIFVTFAPQNDRERYRHSEPFDKLRINSAENLYFNYCPEQNPIQLFNMVIWTGRL